MTELEQLVQVAANGVKKLFDTFNGEIDPHWVIEKDDGDIAIVVTRWSDDQQKDYAEVMIRDFLEVNNCVRFVFVSESWMVTLPPGAETAGLRAMTHPDRVEVITLQAEERDGAHISGHINILRKSDKVELGEIKTYQTFASGRFANMFKNKES